MTSRRSLLAIGAVALVTVGYAGNPEVHFGGRAGPYPVRVAITTSGVIPGLARIIVSVADPAKVDRVTVQPLYWNLPPAQAPAPDPTRAEGPGEYHGELWLMVAGSYGVRIEVHGVTGTGSVIVPVTAVAYERLDMDRSLGTLLAALALFLAAGLVTIVRAAAGESTLAPGATPDRAARRRGWVGLGAGIVAVGFAAAGGRAWWNSVDAAYRARLYRQPALTISAAGGVLTVAIRDSAWLATRDRRPLVPDAGAMGHVLLAGDSAFAHLHASERGEGELLAALPALPAGEYRVLTQVVDSSGFTETLSGSITLPTPEAPVQRSGEMRDGSFWFVPSGRPRPGGEPMTLTPRPGAGFSVELRDRSGAMVQLDSAATEAAEILAIEPDGSMSRLQPHGTMPLAVLTRFSGDSTGALPARNPVTLPFAIEGTRRYWVSVLAGGKRYGAVVQ